MPTTICVEEAIPHLIRGNVRITKLTKDSWYPSWKTAEGTITNLTIEPTRHLVIAAELRDQRGTVIQGIPPFEPNFLRVYLPGSPAYKDNGGKLVICSHAYEWMFTPPRGGS